MKAIRSAYRIATLLLIIWLIASWAEIACKNTKPEPQYNNYNAFVLLTQQGKSEVHTEPARVVSISIDEIEVETNDGNIWAVLVNDGSYYHLNQTILVEFTGYDKDAEITDLIETGEQDSSVFFCHKQAVILAGRLAGSRCEPFSSQQAICTNLKAQFLYMQVAQSIPKIFVQSDG